MPSLVVRHIIAITLVFLAFPAPTVASNHTSFDWDNFRQRFSFSFPTYSRPSLSPNLSLDPTPTPTQTIPTSNQPTYLDRFEYLRQRRFRVQSSPPLTSTPTPTSTPSPTPTTPPSPTPTPQTTNSNPSPTTIPQFLLNQVNQYRQSQGLSKVQSDPYTCEFAKIRAQEISTDFSHSGFQNRINNGTLPYPSYSYITENIAMTSNYQNVVNMWINSPTHAANMRADTPYICIGQYGNYYAYLGWKP